MSAAVKVFERARAAGVQLEARGGWLAYNALLDLVAQMRERKSEILELLRCERSAFLDPATDPEARAGWLSARIGTLHLLGYRITGLQPGGRSSSPMRNPPGIG
jgi:hypothetical protein